MIHHLWNKRFPWNGIGSERIDAALPDCPGVWSGHEALGDLLQYLWWDGGFVCLDCVCHIPGVSMPLCPRDSRNTCILSVRPLIRGSMGTDSLSLGREIRVAGLKKGNEAISGPLRERR
jgi:hypothetical protein